MAKILVVVAILGCMAGGLLASQATVGVAVIGASCLVGILARMAQAQQQHAEVMRTLRSEGPENRRPVVQPS